MANPQVNERSFTYRDYLYPGGTEDQRNQLLTNPPAAYENAETYDRANRLSNQSRNTVLFARESGGNWYEKTQHIADVDAQGGGRNSSPYPFQPAERRWTHIKTAWLSGSSLQSSQVLADSGDEKKTTRSRKGGCWIILAITIILLIFALALGIGLWQRDKNDAVVRGNADSSSNFELLIGGAIDPAYYSTSGAFNGSGIAIASASFVSGGRITLFFQHYTGQIRYMQLLNSGEWVGGTTSEVVASDARNGTPIAAVPYIDNDKDYMHMFYIDQNNTIKERIRTNETSPFWEDGLINKANLIANDAEQVGLQAVWSSSWPDGIWQGGMTLWYASDNTTFKEYGWNYGDDSWAPQGEFNNLNGHAGAGCYTWGEGTVIYSMFVNAKNTVEVYWKDTNSSIAGTPAHPINKWTKTSVEIPDVYPATSLGYTTYFYAQMADSLKFNGYKIKWSAENTEIIDSFTVDKDPGIAGTHLSVTGIDNAGGGKSVVVFYQVDGDDITEYARDSVRGQWLGSTLSIPIN